MIRQRYGKRKDVYQILGSATPRHFALFYHMALGLQVVVEDYVHTDRIKMPTVVVIHLGCFALAAAGIIATLRIAFGR